MPLITRSKILKLLSSRLSGRRLRHSLATEKEAIRLAAHHGEDWHKAATAALLHDLFRCESFDRQLEYLSENSLKLSKQWLLNPSLWHGPCAAVYARRELGVKDRDILSAIRFHTTGRPGMSGVEKVILLADKIEPGRDYDGVEDLRVAAYRSMDEAIALGMRLNLARLCEDGTPLVKEAYGAYNEFAMRQLGQ